MEKVKAKKQTGTAGICLVCLKKLPKAQFGIEYIKKKIGTVCSNDCEAVAWRILEQINENKSSNKMEKLKIVFKDDMKWEDEYEYKEFEVLESQDEKTTIIVLKK